MKKNPLTIRIYGEKGGIEWAQMEPNTLYVKWNDRPMEVVRTGNAYMGAAAKPTPARPADIPKVTSKPLRTFTGISHVPCRPGGAGKRPGRNGRIFRM